MSYGQYVPGLPGVRSAKTATHKVVFKGGYVPELLPAGKLLSGTYSRDPSNTSTINNLQPGMILGKRSSDNLYAPSILGVTSNTEAAGSTTIEVSAAVATELVRRVGTTGTFKLTGVPATGLPATTETVTYSAVNTTTGAITVTAIINTYLAGAFVQPTDGSEDPITFIPDGYGVVVVDQEGTSVASVQLPELPVSGIVQSSQLINWPSEAGLQNWLTARLNRANGGKFTFDHIY